MDFYRRLTGGRQDDGSGHNGASGASNIPGIREIGQSESGSPIYRYDEPTHLAERFRVPQMDEEALARLDSHIDRYVAGEGPEGFVVHEIASDLVHIDIHVISPSTRHDYYTLVTSGMSDLPMRVPPGADAQKYAELLICLPSDWPMLGWDGQLLPNEEAYWPVGNLTFLARFPHEYQTWLGVGHTVPNGDPPKPIAEGISFCGVVLLPPVRFGDGFNYLEVRPGKTIQFLAMVPLYESEMNFKLKYGLRPLLDRFNEHGITELLDLDRPNVCPE